MHSNIHCRRDVWLQESASSWHVEDQSPDNDDVDALDNDDEDEDMTVDDVKEHDDVGWKDPQNVLHWMERC